jgi:hypothetical protein
LLYSMHMPFLKSAVDAILLFVCSNNQENVIFEIF